MSTEYLVKSFDPNGSEMTTRHYSPEMVAIELASRVRQHHTNIRQCDPMHGETTYATVTINTATKPLKRTPMQRRPETLVEAKRPARLKAVAA